MTIRCENVSFAYSLGRRVLHDVSFELPEGITAIVGPNGAGKSTLLRLMLGVLRPSSGRVTLGERDAAAIPAARRAARVAYISQRTDLAAAFTVREVVSLGRFAVGADADAVARAMGQAHVLDLSDRPFTSLSAGQQQRVSLARALAQLDGDRRAGRVLLADEPFSAMDPAHALACGGVLKGLPAANIRSAIVMHDLTFAARNCDHALILTNHGRVSAFGPTSDTLTPPILSAVFGMEFDRFSSAAGPVVVPGIAIASVHGDRPETDPSA